MRSMQSAADRYFQIIVIYLGFKITFYIFAAETDN